MNEARDLGAIAFFGDKYGDIVRVLEAGEHSIELCGGTHVRRLGDIGPLKVTSEGSIGSNLRRIEAVTGFGPIDRLRQEEDLVARAADALGTTPDELPLAAERMRGEFKALRDEVQRPAPPGGRQPGRRAGRGRGRRRGRGPGRRPGARRGARPGRGRAPAAGRPGARSSGARSPTAASPWWRRSTKDAGLHAGELIADAARTVQGGGGKGPELAQAGGRDASRLDEALDQVRAAAGLA